MVAPILTKLSTGKSAEGAEMSRRERALDAATYPLLRRAAINLTREETIPGREQRLDTCPPAVEREVRTHFDNLQRRRQRG